MNNSLLQTLMKVTKYWSRGKTLGINLGGLAAGVYVLTRTQVPYDNNENKLMFMARGSKGDKSGGDNSTGKGDNSD